MSEVTVKELANTVGIPPDRLLSQLKEAGIVLSGTDDLVSDDAKKVLLDHLRSGKPMATKAASNGESTTEDTEQSPRKITLRRKSVGELKLPGSRGRTKTVNVEVRKKRTYVKRSVIEAVEDEKRKEESKQEEALPAEETATKVEGQEQVLPETIEVASEEKVVSDQEEQPNRPTDRRVWSLRTFCLPETVCLRPQERVTYHRSRPKLPRSQISLRPR